jgi:soluble lytic murein transglycosylase-like protein
MSVILKEDFEKVVRKLKKRIWRNHGIWALVVCIALAPSYAMRVEGGLAIKAYQIVKTEFDSIRARQELLNLLRSKPLTAGQALDIADRILSQQEVPVSIALGVMAEESEFKPGAVSDMGARGLMQVLPSTVKRYIPNALLQGGQTQMHDPTINVQVGLLYLGDMKKTFGDWRMALRAYYAGPDNAKNRTFDWYANGVLSKAERYQKSTTPD